MQNSNQNDFIKALVKLSGYLMLIAALAVICFVFLIIVLLDKGQPDILSQTTNGNKDGITANTNVPATTGNNTTKTTDNTWKAPDVNTIPTGKAGEMIRYGREL